MTSYSNKVQCVWYGVQTAYLFDIPYLHIGNKRCRRYKYESVFTLYEIHTLDRAVTHIMHRGHLIKLKNTYLVEKPFNFQNKFKTD